MKVVITKNIKPNHEYTDKGFLLASQAAETREFRIRARRRYAKYLKMFRREYTTEYQLYRDKGKFPRKKTMSPRQSFELNRKYVKDQIRHLDNNVDRPLWTWRVINPKQYGIDQKRYVEARV